MIHWVPTTLDQEDEDVVKQLLSAAPPSLEGGNTLNLYKMLQDGRVVDTVEMTTFRDAGVHFINKHWKRGPVHTGYAHVVPVEIRDAVVKTVYTGDLCMCSTRKCTDPECDNLAIQKARDYIKSYQDATTSTPPKVVVKHADQVRTYTPTLTMLTQPTPGQIQDGVIAKLHIKGTSIQ